MRRIVGLTWSQEKQSQEQQEHTFWLSQHWCHYLCKKLKNKATTLLILKICGDFRDIWTCIRWKNKWIVTQRIGFIWRYQTNWGWNWFAHVDYINVEYFMENAQFVCSYRSHYLHQEYPTVFATNEQASKNSSVVIQRICEW